MKTLWIAAVLALAGCNQSTPQVMLVSDSVGLGYTPYVHDELAGRFDVFHAEGGPVASNDRDTGYFLSIIDRVMRDAGPVDVIHFGLGIWDMDRRGHHQGEGCHLDGDRFNSPEQYRKNLEAIATVFDKSGARVIFATITPIPAGNRCIVESDVAIYNSIVRDVAAEHGYAIDDLNTYIEPYGYLHIGKQAHYVPAGYQLLSYQVSTSIEAAWLN